MDIRIGRLFRRSAKAHKAGRQIDPRTAEGAVVVVYRLIVDALTAAQHLRKFLVAGRPLRTAAEGGELTAALSTMLFLSLRTRRTSQNQRLTKAAVLTAAISQAIHGGISFTSLFFRASCGVV